MLKALKKFPGGCRYRLSLGVAAAEAHAVGGDGVDLRGREQWRAVHRELVVAAVGRNDNIIFGSRANSTPAQKVADEVKAPKLIKTKADSRGAMRSFFIFEPEAAPSSGGKTISRVQSR